METHCFELYKGISPVIDNVMMKLPEKMPRAIWLMTLPWRVRRFLKRNPDTTHVYFHDGLSGLVCSSVKKCSGARTIVTLHGLDVVFPSRWFQRRLSENLRKNIDAVIPVSRATGLECMKRGAPEKRVHVVPNGVDLNMGDVPKDRRFIARLEQQTGLSLRKKKILVSIGRSVTRKGFSWFLNNVLPELDEDIVYFMVGPREDYLQRKLFLFRFLPKEVVRQISLMGVGVDQVAIDEALARPDVKGRAMHLGKLPYNDLVQLLKCSDAFVMPNIRVPGDAEGFGLVALEAVVCGTAVLAADLEGITEAIQHGKNGILVEPENPAAWIKAIHKICRNADYRKKLVSDSLVYTKKRFSWEKMVSSYLALFSGKL
jgi:phosphatidylinositol alpha-1,6-mannosyltransferase